uniref:ARAD1C11946p n=1 Tax=Blastobotrys adeninivorans TaxID=409370 RepID=A0A060T686_BLAAD
MNGQRRSYKGQLCTVRYVGKLPPWGEETALGVEWDDPSRGKNDGSLNGVSYFVTKFKGAGSFVKASKPSDEERSFERAMWEKYVSDEGTQTAVIQVSRSKFIENVGVEKFHRRQKQLDKLQVASVAHMCVGDSPSTVDMGMLRQLDLGYNLISNWATVVTICSRMPRLETLVLNGNRFNPLGETSDHISQVTEVSLISTMMPIPEISTLGALFPNLKTLNLAHNKLNCIENKHLPFEKLVTLDLSFNEFEEVPPVAVETLNLSHNSIKSIAGAQLPSQVKVLNVSYCEISSWDSIDAINESNVHTLRINGNPFDEDMDDQEKESRILGRCGKITKLNGQTISPREREDAELYFMSLVAKGQISYNASSQRWKELCAIHGEPASRQEKEEETTIHSRLVDPVVTYDGTEKTIQVLKTMTVPKFRATLAKHFKLSPLRVVVKYYQDGEYTVLEGNRPLNDLNIPLDRFLLEKKSG